jgi:hypothetical protein
MSSRVFSTFSVVLLVLGRPERLSSSTDTRLLLKHECHSKTNVWLKECFPKASQSISRVLVTDLLSSTQNLIRHIAQFCHPSQTERNTKLKKHSCKNKACSQHDVKWQTDAIGLWSVTLASSLIFFHQGSYNNSSLGTFRYHLVSHKKSVR